MPTSASHRLTSIGIALCLTIAATAQSTSAELERLREENAELRDRLDRLGPAVRALRSQQFLGKLPLGDEPRSRLIVRTVTSVPNPRESDYPDAITIAIADRYSGDDERTPERLLIGMLAIQRRRITESARIRPGNEISAVLFATDEVDDSVRSLHHVDSQDAPGLPMFYATAIEKLSGATITIRAQDAAELTPEQRIERDRATFAARLARSGHGDYDAWHRALAPVRAEFARRVATGDGSIDWEDRCSFQMLEEIDSPPGETWPDPQLRTLLALRDQLAGRGIDLLIVPMPAREHIAGPSMLDTPPPLDVVDPHREELHCRLLDAGLEVIDCREAMQRGLDAFGHVYYDAQCYHPADGAIQIAARLAAQRVWRYEFRRDLDAVRTIRLDHGYPTLHRSPPPNSHRHRAYTSTQVRRADGSPLGEPRPDSPILVIGDSFLDAPRMYGITDANFTAHLAKECGVIARQFARHGGVPRILRHLRKVDRTEFDGVRLCILVLNERSLRLFDKSKGSRHWIVDTIPALQR